MSDKWERGKGQMTDDEVQSHLRPIRAEYVRKVRNMPSGPGPNKPGCPLIGGTLVLVVGLVIWAASLLF